MLNGIHQASSMWKKPWVCIITQNSERVLETDPRSEVRQQHAPNTESQVLVRNLVGPFVNLFLNQFPASPGVLPVRREHRIELVWFQLQDVRENRDSQLKNVWFLVDLQSVRSTAPYLLAVGVGLLHLGKATKLILDLERRHHVRDLVRLRIEEEGCTK